MDNSGLDVNRLVRRLERERRARAEAETIAETSTRSLFEQQRELVLLQTIAIAANDASTVEEAVQTALDTITAYTHWPVGHAYLLDEDNPDVLLPTKLWYLSDAASFQSFKEITEHTSLPRGVGLPGRVLASGQPAWIQDVNADANFPRARHAEAIGVKAAFGFPILAGKEVVGVLEFFAAQSLEPNDRLLEMMSHIGTQLGRVVERKRSEDRIRYMAYHDALTGLPNRWLFRDRFMIALAHARRDDTGLAVVSLDLDRFKLVNDSFGHPTGDALLNAVSVRLKSLIREGDTLARFGGDEFVMLLPGVKRPEDAGRIAESILGAFRVPFALEDGEVHAPMSIGISTYPLDGDTPEMLIRNADTALYRAKESGRNGFQLYLPAMTSAATARLQLESDLRRAVERGEFVLHFQPLVGADEERIVGAEALVRWQHPTRGLLVPEYFISAAEDTGLIIPIGAWVLRESCQRLRDWRAEGLGDLRVAVNLSVSELKHPDFLSSLRNILDETEVPPHCLELEITESIAMGDAEASIQILHGLRELGVRISLDDFGTGFSSLQYLKDLPVNTLKIDRSFIQQVATKVGDGAIAHSIIALAHSMGLQVVAEGVETAAQASFLKQHHCDELQGFLWTQPLPERAFADLLAQGAPPRSLSAVAS